MRRVYANKMLAALMSGLMLVSSMPPVEVFAENAEPGIQEATLDTGVALSSAFRILAGDEADEYSLIDTKIRAIKMSAVGPDTGTPVIQVGENGSASVLAWYQEESTPSNTNQIPYDQAYEAPVISNEDAQIIEEDETGQQVAMDAAQAALPEEEPVIEELPAASQDEDDAEEILDSSDDLVQQDAAAEEAVDVPVDVVTQESTEAATGPQDTAVQPNSGMIYIWSDADVVYMNEDSAMAFCNLAKLTDISGLSGLDFSKVEDASYLFAGDEALLSLADTDRWIPASLKNAEQPFAFMNAPEPVWFLSWLNGEYAQPETSEVEELPEGNDEVIDPEDAPNDPEYETVGDPDNGQEEEILDGSEDIGAEDWLVPGNSPEMDDDQSDGSTFQQDDSWLDPGFAAEENLDDEELDEAFETEPGSVSEDIMQEEEIDQPVQEEELADLEPVEDNTEEYTESIPEENTIENTESAGPEMESESIAQDAESEMESIAEAMESAESVAEAESIVESVPESSEEEKQEEPQKETPAEGQTVFSAASDAESVAEETEEKESITSEAEGSETEESEVKSVEEEPEAEEEEIPGEENAKEAEGKAEESGISEDGSYVRDSSIEDVDFRSMRLLVKTGDASVVAEDQDYIIASYGDLYLIQYSTESEICDAYMRYKERAEFVSVDEMMLAAGDGSDIEEAGTDAGEADYEVTVMAPEGPEMSEDENPLSALETAMEEQGSTVSEKVIALIDTGTSENEHIIERVSMLGDDDPSDRNGHGDAMAAAMVAQEPDARILSIRALDENAVGSVSTIYAAISYAIEKQVDIINLSLYGRCTQENSIIADLIREAVAKGIKVVGAAGNESRNAAGYVPGCIEEAVIVGACDDNGNRVFTSNFGATVDYYVKAASTSLAAARMSAYLLNHDDADEIDVYRNTYAENYAGDLGVVYRFVRASNPDESDPANVMGQISFDVPFKAGEEYIEAQINPHPDRVAIEEVGGIAVFINWGARSPENFLERMITEECSYDPETGIVRIPAEYASENLTAVAIMKDDVEFVQMIPGVDDNGNFYAAWPDTSYDVDKKTQPGSSETFRNQDAVTANPKGTYNDQYASGTYDIWSAKVGTTYDIHKGGIIVCEPEDYDEAWGFIVKKLKKVTDKAGNRVDVLENMDDFYVQCIENYNPKSAYATNDAVESIDGGIFRIVDKGTDKKGRPWIKMYVGVKQNKNQNGGGYCILRTKLGKLRVKKASANKNVSNTDDYDYKATFNVYNSNDKKVAVLTTNEKTGVSGWVSLNPGKYTIEEVKAPKGFKPAAKAVKVTVKAKGKETVEILNQPYIRMKVKLKKVDAASGKKLTGGVFKVQEWNGSKYVDYKVDGKLVELDDSNNYTSSVWLFETDKNEKKFKVVETKNPEYYTGTYEQEFKLELDDNDRLQTLNLNDIKIPENIGEYEFRCIKVDAMNNKVPISGAEFVIYPFNVKKNRYEAQGTTLVEKQNGGKPYYVATVQRTKENGGKFKIVETKAPEGYELTAEDIFWTITDKTPHTMADIDMTKYYKFADDKDTPDPMFKYGRIELTKKDEDNAPVTGGGEFKVYEWSSKTKAYKPQAIDTLKYNGGVYATSSAVKAKTSGKAAGSKYYMSITSKDLNKDDPGPYNNGKFKIVETKAPDGYIIDKTPIEVKFDSEEAAQSLQIKSVSKTNKKNKYEIIKVASDGTTRIDATFKIWCTDGTGSAIVNGTERSINGTGISVGTINGVITLEKIKPGNYSFQETAVSDPRYRVIDTVFNFKVSISGLVNGKAKDTKKVYNTTNLPLYVRKVNADGNKKTGENGFPDGTTFAIYEYSVSNKAFKKAPSMSLKWDANVTDPETKEKGMFVDSATGAIPVLAYTAANSGKFRISETSATPGYILDSTVQPLEVPKNPGETKFLTATFTNTPNQFTIRKVDLNGKKLKGVLFEIGMVDGAKEELTTNDSGMITKKALAPGRWYYKELDTLDGYKLDPKTYYFTVSATGKITAGKTADALEADVTVENKKTKRVYVKKVDAETGLEYEANSGFPKGTTFAIHEYDRASRKYKTKVYKYLTYMTTSEIAKFPKTGHRVFPKTGSGENKAKFPKTAIANITKQIKVQVDNTTKKRDIEFDFNHLSENGYVRVSVSLGNAGDGVLAGVRQLARVGAVRDMDGVLKVHDSNGKIYDLAWSGGIKGTENKKPLKFSFWSDPRYINTGKKDKNGNVIYESFKVNDLKTSSKVRNNYADAVVKYGSMTWGGGDMQNVVFFTKYYVLYEKNTTGTVSNMPKNLYITSVSGGHWEKNLTSAIIGQKSDDDTTVTTPTKASETKVFTVTYNTNGGAAVTAKSIGTRAWSFSKWTTAEGSGGTTYKAGSKYSTKAPLRLYAHWTQTVSSNSLTLPSTTKTGYTFAGWYTDSALTKKAGDAGASYNVTASQKLYAKWTANSYSVKFNPNKGSGSSAVNGTMSNQSFKYGTAQALTANAFTRTGYSFVGWDTKADGSGTNYSNKQSVKNLATSGTVNLYAQWKANTYTVKYNANGGTGTTASSTHTYDTAKALTKNGFTRTGYTFAGWAASSSATSAAYTNQQSVKNLAGSGTVNLYAVWTINKYTLTVNPNGGTFKGKATNTTITQNYNTTCELEDPVRPLYTFTGWERSVGGSLSGSTFTFTGNGTVTAKWKLDDCDLLFDANGGTGTAMPSVSMKGGITVNIPSCTYTRSGYTFENWNTKANGSGTNYAVGGKISSPTGSDIKLYAQWKPIEYKITVNYDKGTAPSGQPTTYNVTTSTFSLKHPSKTGFVFVGWKQGSSTDVVAEATIRKGSTGDKSFTAVYIENGMFVDKDTAELAEVAETASNEGKFSMEELTATPGYIRDKSTKYFSTDDADGNGLITVEFENIPNHFRFQKRDESDHPIEGIKFNVWYGNESTKKSYTTDKNGFVNLNRLKPGTWHYQEDAASAAAMDYVPDKTVKSFVVDEDGNPPDTKDNWPKVGNTKTPNSVIIYKEDETGKRIADVSFDITTPAGAKLYDENGTQVTSPLFTNSEGCIVLKGLANGTYTFKESANQPRLVKGQYILDTTTHTFTVSGGKVTGDNYITVVNRTNHFQLKKVDASDASKVLGGAEFRIWNDLTGAGKFDQRLKTDTVTGLIKVDSLAAGTWHYQEISAPDGYQIDNRKYDFTVADNGLIDGKTTYSVTVKDSPNELQLVKVDEEGNRLSPVRFQISNDDGWMEEFTDDGNGVIKLSGLLPGEYTFEELSAPEGYLANRSGTFAVRNDGKVEVESGLSAGTEIETTISSSSADISGIGSDGNEIGAADFKAAVRDIELINDQKYAVTEIAAANGRKFALNDYDEPDGSSQTFMVPITDEGVGTLKFYVQTEMDDGESEEPVLVMDPAEISVSVSYTVKKVTLAELKLTDRKNSFSLLKVDGETGDPLPGVTFKFGFKPAVSGTTGPIADGASYTTGENGYLVIDGKTEVSGLPAGTYTIHETANEDPAYIINDAEYSFTIGADGKPYSTDSEAEYDASSISFRIINEREQGYPVYVVKENEMTGETLTDDAFQFELYEWDKGAGKYVTTGSSSALTDASVFVEEGAEPEYDFVYAFPEQLKKTAVNEGRFLMKETSAAQGYEAEWSQEFTYEEAEAAAQEEGALGLVLHATDWSNAVEIHKVDENGQPLDGATFLLWREAPQDDEDGAQEAEPEELETVNGVARKEMLPDGTWHFQEKEVPDGYVPDMDAEGNRIVHTFTVTDGKVDGSIEKTYTVTDHKPVSAAIRLKKVNGAGETLKNVAFEVYEFDKATGKYSTDAIASLVYDEETGLYQSGSEVDMTEENLGKFMIAETASSGTLAPDFHAEIQTDWTKHEDYTAEISYYDMQGQKTGTGSASVHVTNDGRLPVHEFDLGVVVNEDNKLRIRKTDENGTALAGAQFVIREIYHAGSGQEEDAEGDGRVLHDEEVEYKAPAEYEPYSALVETGADGYAELTGLADGRYTMTELKGVEGHAIDDTVWTIIVENGLIFEEGRESEKSGTYTVKAVNRTNKLTIYKKSLLTGKPEPLAGVRFEARRYAETQGDLTAAPIETRTVETDADGVATLKGLADGAWYLRETHVPEGSGIKLCEQDRIFIVFNGLINTQYDEIREGKNVGEYEMTIWNDDDKGFDVNVVIQKVDSKTNEPLTGAEFTVYEYNAASDRAPNESYEVLRITDDDGDGIYKGTMHATAKNQGRFYIKETVAPDKYYADWAEWIDGFVKKDWEFTISSETEVRESHNWLVIHKIDANTKASLNDCVIDVWSDKDQTHKTFTTGTVTLPNGETMEGAILLEDLANGTTYHFQEIKEPNGYIRDAVVFDIEVSDDGNIYGQPNYVYEFENEPRFKLNLLTGGLGRKGIYGIGAAMMAAMIAVVLWFRKKKKAK